MNQSNDAIFVQEICEHLDASIAHLPTSIEQQLSKGRQAALRQLFHSALAGQSAEGFAQSAFEEMSDNSDLAAEIPTKIEERLNQIRHDAVARFEQLQQEENTEAVGLSLSGWLKSQFDAFNFSASAGMLATACILVTAISLFYVNSRLAGTLTLEEEIGLVATAEDIELYENLEFYLWLAESESLSL